MSLCLRSCLKACYVETVARGPLTGQGGRYRPAPPPSPWRRCCVMRGHCWPLTLLWKHSPGSCFAECWPRLIEVDKHVPIRTPLSWAKESTPLLRDAERCPSIPGPPEAGQLWWRVPGLSPALQGGLSALLRAADSESPWGRGGGRGSLFLPSGPPPCPTSGPRAWNQRALELERARGGPSQGGKLSPGRRARGRPGAQASWFAVHRSFWNPCQYCHLSFLPAVQRGPGRLQSGGFRWSRGGRYHPGPQRWR